MIKGFPTTKKSIANPKEYLSQAQVEQAYATLQNIGSDRVALDVIPKSVYPLTLAPVVLSTGNTVRVLKFGSAHNARVGDIVRFSSGNLINMEVAVLAVPDSTTILLATELSEAPVDSTDSVEIMRHITLTISSSGELSVALSPLTVVDMLDPDGTTGLQLWTTETIPANASAPIVAVASTAAIIKKIKVVEDIGEFIGLYSDPSGSPVLEAVLPLGGGEIDINIPAGTELGLRNMKNASINLGSLGSAIAINFLG